MNADYADLTTTETEEHYLLTAFQILFIRVNPRQKQHPKRRRGLTPLPPLWISPEGISADERGQRGSQRPKPKNITF